MIRKALISPGYGAGWSTWMWGDNGEAEFALFDADLIAAIEKGEKEKGLEDFGKRYEAKFGDEPYLGGGRDLEVRTIEGEFQVDEYDGSESVRVRSEQDWY